MVGAGSSSTPPADLARCLQSLGWASDWLAISSYIKGGLVLKALTAIAAMDRGVLFQFFGYIVTDFL